METRTDSARRVKDMMMAPARLERSVWVETRRRRSDEGAARVPRRVIVVRIETMKAKMARREVQRNAMNIMTFRRRL